MDPFWWFIVLLAGIGIGTWLFRPRGRHAAAEIAYNAEEPLPPDDGLTPEERNATRMRIEFALFENEEDEAVIEDSITLTDAEQTRTYQAKAGDTSREYVVTFQFGRPSSSIDIKAPTWAAAIATGVHESSETEEMSLAVSATLAFKCTPLP